MELVKGRDGIRGVEDLLSVIDRRAVPPIVFCSVFVHDKTSPIIIIVTMPIRMKKASVPIPDKNDTNFEESRLVVVYMPH